MIRAYLCCLCLAMFPALAYGESPDPFPVAPADPLPVFTPAPNPAPSSPGQVWYMRIPVGHTHTCGAGHTWDHSANSSHNCIAPVERTDGSWGTCGLFQNYQDASPRMVHIFPTAPIAGKDRDDVFTDSRSLLTLGAGCANGNCAAGAGFASRGGLFRGGVFRRIFNR